MLDQILIRGLPLLGPPLGTNLIVIIETTKVEQGAALSDPLGDCLIDLLALRLDRVIRKGQSNSRPTNFSRLVRLNVRTAPTTGAASPATKRRVFEGFGLVKTNQSWKMGTVLPSPAFVFANGKEQSNEVTIQAAAGNVHLCVHAAWDVAAGRRAGR